VIGVDGQDKSRATLIGASAIVMWGTLAALTAASGPVPPFLLTALTFGIAALLSLAKWLLRGEDVMAHLRQPWQAWAVGVGGLFGYHALYFLALQSAPPVEVSLVNYLWPLLIVLFSALLPGQHLKPRHVLGGLLGFAGAALAVTQGRLDSFDASFTLGYLAALGCAVTWAAYSVLSGRLKHVPTDAVGGHCAATCLLAILCHLLFETAVWPEGWQWLAVLALGAGPVGSAFFLWDWGLKRGNIQTLGQLGYFTPPITVTVLVSSGLAQFHWTAGLALILIVGGAAVGTLKRA
jgi:drug/metabolite transporter (DMT)-like permease